MDKLENENGTDEIISKLASLKDDRRLNVTLILEEDELGEKETNKNNNHEENLKISDRSNQNDVKICNKMDTDVQKLVLSKNSNANVGADKGQATFTNPLDIVAENLLCFIKMHTYIKSLDLNEETMRFRLQCCKEFYFNLLYHIVLDKILPLENDKTFIESFLFCIIKKSQMNIKYESLHNLFIDMSNWTKEKHRKMTIESTQNSYRDTFSKKYYNVDCPQVPTGATAYLSNGELPKSCYVSQEPNICSNSQNYNPVRAETAQINSIPCPVYPAMYKNPQETSIVVPNNQRQNMYDTSRSRNGGVSSETICQKYFNFGRTQSAKVPTDTLTSSNGGELPRKYYNSNQPVICPKSHINAVRTKTTQRNSNPNSGHIEILLTKNAQEIFLQDNQKQHINDVSRSLSRDSGVSSPLFNSTPNQMIYNDLQDQREPMTSAMNQNASYIPANSSYIPASASYIPANASYMSVNASHTAINASTPANTSNMPGNISNMQTNVKQASESVLYGMLVNAQQPAMASFLPVSAFNMKPNIPYVATNLTEYGLNFQQF